MPWTAWRWRSINHLAGFCPSFYTHNTYIVQFSHLFRTQHAALQFYTYDVRARAHALETRRRSHSPCVVVFRPLIVLPACMVSSTSQGSPQQSVDQIMHAHQWCKLQFLFNFICNSYKDRYMMFPLSVFLAENLNVLLVSVNVPHEQVRPY
jgi:hypothetical protein